MGQSRSGTRPATYDDVLALPEHVVGEIIGGEVQRQTFTTGC